MSQRQYKRQPNDPARQVRSSDINAARAARDNLVAAVQALNAVPKDASPAAKEAAAKGKKTKADNRTRAERTKAELEMERATEKKQKTTGGLGGDDPLEAWRKKKAEMDKKSEGLDAIEGLAMLRKGEGGGWHGAPGSKKGRQRKRGAGGKWVYRDAPGAGGGKVKRGSDARSVLGGGWAVGVIEGLPKDLKDFTEAVEAGNDEISIDGIARAIKNKLDNADVRSSQKISWASRDASNEGGGLLSMQSAPKQMKRTIASEKSKMAERTRLRTQVRKFALAALDKIDRSKEVSFDKSGDAIEGLEGLSKGPHKYKSRKKVGGKWVYDYGDKSKAKPKKDYKESERDFEAQVSEAADLWFNRASRATQQGRSVNFNLYYTESSPGKAGQLHILHADDTPGPNMKLGDPQAMRGNLTRDQARAKIHTAARRLPIIDPTSYKSGDAVDGLEELSKARYYDMDYGSGKMTAKYAGARWPEKESAFMGKSKGDIIQELIAKMEAGDITQELIGKMKAAGVADDVVQQLIGRCNTRKARKSHFEPSLKKGLYAFELSGSESKGRKLADNLLPQYLAAFVEQAYEHEKQECEHMKNKPTGYDDQLNFFAMRIMNELVVYMRNNPDLLAAGKDATGASIASILRNSGLVQPDVSGYTNNEGNGYAGEVAHYSKQAPWIQEDPGARPSAQLADRHEQGSFIDDTEDPAIALRKAQIAATRRAFTAPEPEFVVKGDGDCPVHGYGDLTKMQNLLIPPGHCTCN